MRKKILKNLKMALIFFSGLSFPLDAQAGSFQTWGSYVGEEGVQQREILQIFASHSLGIASMDYAFKWANGTNPGLAAAGLGAHISFPKVLNFTLAVQGFYENFPTWNFSETKLQGLLTFQLKHWLKAFWGMAYRDPAYKKTFWQQLTNFGRINLMPEYTVFYRLESRTYLTSKAGFYWAFGTYDRWQTFPFDYWHFWAGLEFLPSTQFKISLETGTALKGMSGIILSMNEIFANIGFSYGF